MPGLEWLKPLFGFLDKPTSIQELRHHAEETPSLANQVSLAQALHDADEFEEAAKLFEDVLARDSTSPDGLYGLGVSRVGLGDDEGAIEPLRQLVDSEPSHHDYDGWAKLSHALWKLERRQESIETSARQKEPPPATPHGLRLLSRSRRESR